MPMHVWRMGCAKCGHMDSRNYFAGDPLPAPMFCSCGHALWLVSGELVSHDLQQLAELSARRVASVRRTN